ncbi:TIR domain-containing adapter molecule 1 [Notolabrus celidotus]|uniref:TIR domain-containing adapter molecule 1 n=1 Tax=Notolabrus celidotus TaxID=1203425 RepID=UPI00148FB3FE|nr:TIR domain-containing adapter molecule 1 [Notolabrus celidotus]XP_034559642.1 TIR domain-containing adapter molecule 1 [Notolabrus celidotus]
MSHRGGEENQGTGLSDVLDSLVKGTPERLLSLTLQLGESPEDRILHALCLIVLQREAQALEKLQTLKENHLAHHLAENWQLSGGKLEEFRVRCGHFHESKGQFLAAFARIFKVLSEQKLCDQQLRNLAYKRAVSRDDQQTSSGGDLEYFKLREEAKEVCGPEFAEWMYSCTDLKSGSYSDPLKSQNEGITALNVSQSQDQSERRQNMPCTLQASCSVPSYPSELEISMPATAPFGDDKGTAKTSEESKISTPVLLVGESEAESSPQTSEELESVRPPLLTGKEKSGMFESPEASSKLNSLIHPTPNQTNKPTREPQPAATNIFLPNLPIANEMKRSTSVDEEEEEIFYAFVILHAPEDVDMAEILKERLENVTGQTGAIFSEDFALVGRSTLRCVEDAINNSAFTLLLLTRNFDTPMQELEADSALINSINRKHKYNTVIPLLPQENCMPREDIPLVIRTKNPLLENKNFDRRVQKAITPAVVKKQRKLWTEEQMLKMQKKKQEELKQSNEHQKKLLKESKATEMLEREKHLLGQRLPLGPGLPQDQDGGDGRAVWPQQPNIHIERANYIMIGNDSRMTVGLPGGADNDDSIYREGESEEE